MTSMYNLIYENGGASGWVNEETLPAFLKIMKQTRNVVAILKARKKQDVFQKGEKACLRVPTKIK